MPRNAKKVSAALERKGFERRDAKDAYFHLWADGKKTPIYTKISHGEREIHDGLLGRMALQLKLRRAQFDDLIECPLSREDYVGILREEGHIGEVAVETPPPPDSRGGPARTSKKRTSKKRSE